MSKLCFAGGTHLALTLAEASRRRGFQIVDTPPEANIVFIALDVLDHRQLDDVNDLMERVLSVTPPSGVPVVVVSQVPPGWTRKWSLLVPHRMFYQVDTIIVSRAVERATNPEQMVVGSTAGTVPLPRVYREYLEAFECPIEVMSYESAEMVKCCINFFLTSQIISTNLLSEVSSKVRADWDDVVRGLRHDVRIGEHAYLRPGLPNRHLQRDVDTIHEWAFRKGVV